MRNAYATRIPADWEQFAAVFSALGDSYRQRILLFFEPGERLTIKQIADVLPLSRTAVLHHVRVLQSAGLLESSKEGREVAPIPSPRIPYDDTDDRVNQQQDRKSTRLNSSHSTLSRMPSSA